MEKQENNARQSAVNTNRIVLFANQKGGVGKTTICGLFSNYLSNTRGIPLLVVDADPLPKTVGKEGATSFCKVNKDILATFRRYSVGGYSTQTMVNAILRSFILHYKKQFNEYRIKERPLL